VKEVILDEDFLGVIKGKQKLLEIINTHAVASIIKIAGQEIFVIARDIQSV